MIEYFSDYTWRDLEIDNPDCDIGPQDDHSLRRLFLACVLVFALMYAWGEQKQRQRYAIPSDWGGEELHIVIPDESVSRLQMVERRVL